MDMDTIKVLIISLGVMVAGLASLFSVRKLDRRDYIIQKITPLSLALVSECQEQQCQSTAIFQ